MKFLILLPEAADSTGFKSAVQKEPIGSFEDLEEARKAAFAAGGGAIFKMCQPIEPEVPGGRQRWGEPIEIKDLEWQCLVTVVTPRTLATRHLGLD